MKTIGKIKILVLCLCMGILLVSCGPLKEDKEDTEIPDEVVEILSKDEQDSIMRDFYNIVGNSSDREAILGFIDKNIKSLDMENREIMIDGLEDFLSSTDSSMEEDYILLSKYTDYVSGEMKSYIEIFKRETGNTFTDGEALNVGIDEILDRGLAAERYIQDFPKGKRSKMVFDLYVEYMKASIFGMGNQYIFAEEGSSKIKDEYLNIYESFIQSNMDTKAANILTKYVDILKRNQGDMNSEEVNRFYDDLEITIGENF